MARIDKWYDRFEEWHERHRDELFTAGIWLFRLAIFVACMIVLFIAGGCKSKQVVTTTNSQQKTLISERFDSAHTVAGDSATAALLFRCDSLGNVYLSQLNTEQGKRLRLELQISTLQATISKMENTTSVVGAKNATTTNSEKPNYQPLLLTVDCKEDSFEVVIRGLRERIAYMEEHKEKEEVPVRYVPKYYKNMEKGFWSLLVLLLLALALLVWKNWSKIAAWAIKVYAKFRL